jgi:hypothetical protein
MGNYVFVYSGGNGVSEDETERAAQYGEWGKWFEMLGAAIVDGGQAVGAAKTVSSGSVRDGGSCGITGYSVIAANSLDAAVELAKGCPVIRIGGAVDIYEAIAM